MKTKTELQAEMSMAGKNGRYSLYKINRIGYVDIEATNLKAPVGHVLTIVNHVRDVSSRDQIIDTRKYVITKKEIDDAVKDREFNPDKRIITEFFEDIDDIDLLIGHWFHGMKRFDMPFLRGRASLMGILDLVPTYGNVRYGDTWRQGKTTVSSLGWGLDALGHIVGAPVEKTKLSGFDWWLASHGDKKAIEYVLKHNIIDCQLTYRVHKSLERFNSIPGGLV